MDTSPQIEPVTTGSGEVELALERAKESVPWLWLLWQQRRFLAQTAVWGLVLSTMLAFMIPKRYQSTTRLMPPEAPSGSAAIAALGSGRGGGLGLTSVAGDLLGAKSAGALFVDILGGRTVQDRLIDRFDLRKVYHRRYWHDTRKDLAKFTTTSEDRKSGVITITVTDRDPRRAAQLAQAYVEELDRLVAQVSTSSARRERIFIEQRLQRVKQELDAASRQFSQYASQNTAIDITTQAKATVEAAAKLEGELIAAQSELEALQQVYTRNNVRVRSSQARVNELRAQLHKIGGETSDAFAAPVRETAASQEFPSIRQLPLLGVKWADLYRQSKIQETVYELLTQQYELAKIEEAKEIPVVKVLDAANVPEKRSFPPSRVVMGILGMVISSGLACCCILGRGRWQDVNPEAPYKIFAHEVFIGIMSMGKRKDHDCSDRQARRRR